jgi:hypothetical protein
MDSVISSYHSVGLLDPFAKQTYDDWDAVLCEDRR